MSLCVSVMPISKMVFLPGLLVVIAHTNVLYARTSYGPYSLPIQSKFTEKSGREIDQVIAEERKTIPYTASARYTPAEHTNVIESGPHRKEKPEKDPYFQNVDENERYPLVKAQNAPYGTTKYVDEIENGPYPPSRLLKENKVELYLSGKPVKGNESDLALITIPTSYIRELDTTKRQKSPQLLPTYELTENTGTIPAQEPLENVVAGTGNIMIEIPLEQVKSSSLPFFPFTIKGEFVNRYSTTPDGYPVIQKASPLRVQQILPPLSKDEQLPHNPLKPQQLSERDPYDADPKNAKDPISLLPANTDVESTHCIDKIESSSYTIPLSHAIDILPMQVQDPILPLFNRIGENDDHNHTSEKVFEEIHIDKFHEPLPPLSKGTYPPTMQDIASLSFHTPIPPLQVPDTKVPQTVALPITGGPYPAAVVASGPYPANVSVLKDFPIIHFSEPLPPLQNAVPTNLETPKSSTLLVPQGPYPANLPIGHSYPPAI